MSTDQPTLSELDSAADEGAALHEQTLGERGAAYAPSDNANASAPQQDPENECLNCGESIPSHIARVLGNNDGCVPACVSCADGYDCTARVLKAVRSDQDGAGIDPTAGGRR